MKPIDRYLEALKRIQRRSSLHLDVQPAKDELRVDHVRFTHAPRPTLFQASWEPNQGVLAPALTPDEVAYCREHRISYLTLDERLFLVKSKYTLAIDSRRAERKLKPEQPLNRWWHQPTLLISPNGLPILDVLFRLPAAELAEFPSALSFARKYKLNQSKLSIVMRSLNVHTLPDLKKQIRALPMDWWKLALAYPATKKGLTPFFHHAKPFQMIESAEPEAVRKRLAEWRRSNRAHELVPGPVEVAKGIGALTDPDLYLWGTATALQALKQKFRLVPGKSRDKPTWHLATPQREMLNEAILSRVPRASPDEPQPNFFRAIWDLTFGSERLKEARLEMLQKFTAE